MAAKSKRDAVERQTLGDCLPGEVAILRDPVIDGCLRQMVPGTVVKIWHAGANGMVFVSVIGADNREGAATYVAETSRVKAMVKRMNPADPGVPQDTDPLQRDRSLL